jgi:hypothetical protein
MKDGGRGDRDAVVKDDTGDATPAGDRDVVDATARPAKR